MWRWHPFIWEKMHFGQVLSSLGWEDQHFSQKGIFFSIFIQIIFQIFCGNLLKGNCLYTSNSGAESQYVALLEFSQNLFICICKVNDKFLTTVPGRLTMRSRRWLTWWTWRWWTARRELSPRSARWHFPLWYNIMGKPLSQLIVSSGCSAFTIIVYQRKKKIWTVGMK